MDPIEARLRQAVRSHGLDPNDPDIDAEIQSLMRLMTEPPVVTPYCPMCGNAPKMMFDNIAFCPSLDCKALCWDVTMTLRELQANAKLINLGIHTRECRNGHDNPE